MPMLTRIITRSSIRTIILSVLLVAVVLIVLPGVTATAASVPSQAARHTVYLPLVVRGGATADPTPVPPPQGASGALMFGDKSYRSAGIAVDRQGGMHAVFIRVAPFDYTGEPAPTYYAYCPPANPAACARRDGWSLTALEQGYLHAQIEVTPDGRPRILMIQLTESPDGGFLPGHLYRYAECDQQCSVTSSWRFTTVLISRSGGGMHETDYTYQNFELDPQGRPRFVYQDRANSSGAHRGSWYVFCDAQCGTHSAEDPHWFETRIDNPDEAYNLYMSERAVLKFSPEGYPRILTGIDPVQYVECNAQCDLSESWPRAASLLGTGSGASAYTWSLAVDTHGRPWATIYPRGGPLYYAWCNEDCTSDANWTGSVLDFGNGSGQYSALALDAQNRPRIAYRDGDSFSMGYAWCNQHCETMDAQWTSQVAEESNAINVDLNVPVLPTCVRGSWFGGLRPVLVLDRQGNPRIAYDAEYLMECRSNPDNPNDGTTYVETKWWASRVVFFPQPN